ncbi:hypothetical protein [Vibrio harveyi]|uniref:hypothetical protein n=1 Tax=Vibrio harveyi TaxID=669 RepID=UPI003CF6A3A0
MDKEKTMLAEAQEEMTPEPQAVRPKRITLGNSAGQRRQPGFEDINISIHDDDPSSALLGVSKVLRKIKRKPRIRIVKDKQTNEELVKAIELILKHQGELEIEEEERLESLSETSTFTDSSFTDIALLKKFSDARDELLLEYDFVNKDALALLLGVANADKTERHAWNRKLSRMRETNKILWVKYQNDFLYPLFQMTETGEVNSNFTKWLPKLYEGRSGWDICFWLDTEKTVLMERAKATFDQVQEAFNEGLEAHDKLVSLEASQSVYLTDTPLNLAYDENSDNFDTFCEDLLNFDERVIPTKDLELGDQ